MRDKGYVRCRVCVAPLYLVQLNGGRDYQVYGTLPGVGWQAGQDVVRLPASIIDDRRARVWHLTVYGVLIFMPI